MALKLGELLLKEKLITPEQLNEALSCHVVFGIKLGSSLLELGYLTDEQLCALLSRALGVPPVSARALASVSPEVLALVPLELAEKYRIIPIKLEGKRLSLAMADPSDFKAIDEVAFATGLVVLPHVAPDRRITAALSSYYHVRGDIRYLRAAGELATQRRNAPRSDASPSAHTIQMPTFNDRGELLNVEVPLEFEGFANLPGHVEDVFPDTGDQSHYSVDRLSLDFASAKTRDQVADLFISYLCQEFSVGALFIIRNNMAAGWRGMSAGQRISGLDQVSILLSKPSVIRDVWDTQRFAMGALVQTPENGQILKALGVSSRTPLLVLPIIMHRKVVAAVVVTADMEALGKRLQELQKLVYKASLAFEMLIIKNKILMT